VNLHTAQGARGSRSPGSSRPERAPLRRLRRIIRVLPGGWRAELLAGTTFALMIALAAVGWCTAPGDHTAAPTSPATNGTPYQFTATAVPTGGLTTAAALILGVLILGAAAIGVLFFTPRTNNSAAPPKWDRQGAVHRLHPHRHSGVLLAGIHRRDPGQKHAGMTSGASRPSSPVRSWRPAAGTPYCSWTSSAGRSAGRWPGASPGRTARAAACE